MKAKTFVVLLFRLFLYEKEPEAVKKKYLRPKPVKKDWLRNTIGHSTVILYYMQKKIVRLIKKVMLRGGQFGIGSGTLFSPKVWYCMVQKWRKKN